MQRFYPLFFVAMLCTSLVMPSALARAQENGHLSNALLTSFSLKNRAERYTLLEDDFDDIPHRITRYDFLKEDAEPLRLFSRPAGPECMILNLQWQRGSIFINDLKIVPGQIKKRKWLTPDNTSEFFYRLFSARNQAVQEARMEIRPVLHFDALDEQTSELAGGALERDEFDFILKIPLIDKSAKKILFYRQPRRLNAQQRTMTGAVPEETLHEIQIGGTEF